MDVVPVDQIPAEGGEDAISAEHDALAEPLNNDPSHYSGKSYNHFVVTSYEGKLNITTIFAKYKKCSWACLKF